MMYRADWQRQPSHEQCRRGEAISQMAPTAWVEPCMFVTRGSKPGQVASCTSSLQGLSCARMGLVQAEQLRLLAAQDSCQGPGTCCLKLKTTKPCLTVQKPRGRSLQSASAQLTFNAACCMLHAACCAHWVLRLLSRHKGSQAVL